MLLIISKENMRTIHSYVRDHVIRPARLNSNFFFSLISRLQICQLCMHAAMASRTGISAGPTLQSHTVENFTIKPNFQQLWLQITI